MGFGDLEDRYFRVQGLGCLGVQVLGRRTLGGSGLGCCFGLGLWSRTFSGG